MAYAYSVKCEDAEDVTAVRGTHRRASVRFVNVENGGSAAIRIFSSRIWIFTCAFFRGVRYPGNSCWRAVEWLDLGMSCFAVLMFSASMNCMNSGRSRRIFVNFDP
jgi:hypothetical protein